MSLPNFNVVEIVNFVGFGYVDTPLSAAEELAEEVATKFLPVIAGLDSCVTSAERVAVLRSTAAQLRAEFIALHGDPFDFEKDVVSAGASVRDCEELALAAL